MKQRIAAFLMCVICLLSVVGCGQTKADTNTPSAANQQTVTDDYPVLYQSMFQLVHTTGERINKTFAGRQDGK